jgi:V/A-type H+/Na+-transporting ATPase subunit I
VAIEPVKKITVISHKSLEDEVVNTLTRLSTVHVDKISDIDLVGQKELSEEESLEVRRLSLGISQVEFLLGFLKEYSDDKPGFIKTMIKDKYQMSYDEFELSGQRTDLELVYAECSEMQRRLIGWRDARARFEREAEELKNWATLEIPLSEFGTTGVISQMPVRIYFNDIGIVQTELEEEAPESELEVISRRANWLNCLLLSHPSAEDAVADVLARHRFEPVELPDLPDEPRDRMEQVLREISAIDRRREELLKRLTRFFDYIGQLEVLREYMISERRKIEITSSFGTTASTVAINGWVAERGVDKTLRRLEKVSDDVVVELEDPGEDDHPPVSLINPDWARPFELLVNLFGPPSRREHDPTIAFAISFSIFFGFCIGDVGYGILLVIAFLLMRKYLPLGQKAKDFLTALTYGSACAIVIGVLTGSWFGIETARLPHLLRSMVVFDALHDTLLVMLFFIAIGAVHMLFGVGFEFRDNWKAGNKTDALIDQGLVFLLFAGGGLAVGLAVAKVVPTSAVFIVGGTAILLMLLLLGRSAKSIAGKAVNGVYETYGTVVGFISDSISYVRLLALGLSTFIIGYVINTMAGLVRGIGPVIGILFMLIILIVGHTFNVVINLLSAFVHPLRLEFVEFFGKFYEDGGGPFNPLGVDSKIVIINDEGGPEAP